MADLHWLGIAEIGRLYRAKKLSPAELVQALLKRIGELDGKVHAFIRVDGDAALEAARKVKEFRGPLDGIPYAPKDNIDVAGIPTTCSSKILIDNVAVADAPVSKRMREAGAIFMGKVTLHEFARGGSMFDLPWPAARNPWNLKLHPGGSSSGSGVALACGFVPAAIGTDTGGSVRHPATVCGVVGLKPTFDLVSCEGVFPLAPSLDHVGPMTRNVEDNALLLEAMTGQAGKYTAQLAAGAKGLRIGVIEHFWTEQKDVDPDHLGNLQQALDVLRGAGARVEPVKLSPLRDWTECGRLVQTWEQYQVHAEWLKTRPQDYSATAREKLLEGKKLALEDVQAAERRRASLRAEFSAVMQGYDALVTLSSFHLPCEIDIEAVKRTYSGQGRIPFNLTGTPCLSVPTGFTSGGLPTAMQVAGKANDEAMLYRISKAYEDATRWGERHPPL